MAVIVAVGLRAQQQGCDLPVIVPGKCGADHTRSPIPGAVGSRPLDFRPRSGYGGGMRASSQVVYVSADCNGTGIEVKAGDGPLVMTDPAELGVSLPLRGNIANWQRWYDGVFGLFEPAERYAALGDKFDEVGRRL